jgi:ABC-type multidrug transport system ATPase subunit/pSer/pThr/pTyr-binding forkhead associated (FHA) protein
MSDKANKPHPVAHPFSSPTREQTLVVCPACSYGFPELPGSGPDYVCPRPECRHRWHPATPTIAAVHGSQRRQARYELHVRAGNRPQRLELPEGETFLGRDPQCQLVLDNLNVSRRHARVVRQGNWVWVEDLGSSWGSFLNGQPVKGKALLKPGDELTVGGAIIQFAIRFEPAPPDPELLDNTFWIAQAEKASPQVGGQQMQIIPLYQTLLTFGRGPDRDVVLPDPMISRRHAVLEVQGSVVYLSDTQSGTGTYVNGKSIIRARLEGGDRIQFGPYLFRFEGNHLVWVRTPTSLGVSAAGLSQSVGRICLLDHVSLAFNPGEFVGLLGPSGAGKTTLLNALTGLRPARTGQVYVNGEPLYEQYERLRHLIGYVPQEDIIHRELTSRLALTYAGRLRLPRDVSRGELARLVEETLTALDLAERADVVIGRLSGGQRKRVSVGVELLSRPGILFLDEPTSGLDPSTESLLMRKLQRIAHQGRTVVCTTHVMENVDLFDKVAVLAPGGRLAYFGPPAQAKTYFGIDKFTLLYDRLEEKPPEVWQEEYRQSPLHQELVFSAERKAPPDGAQPNRRTGPPATTSWLSQLAILSGRFWKILWSDKLNLALLAGQPLLIAGLISGVFKEQPVIGFLLVIAALWFGCSVAAQQIVKERPVYRRERMVNLRVDAYVLSKFFPLAAVSTAQCALMLAIVAVFRGLEGNLLIHSLGLSLAAANGVALGLIISAQAANADKAMSVVPLVLMPQIILAGSLVPLPGMNWGTWAASHLAVARWANQTYEVGLLEGRRVDAKLLAPGPYFRSLWNLYPSYDLKKEESRQDFLKDHGGKPVRRLHLLTADALVMAVFLVGQLAAVMLILRRQDPW